VRHALHHAAVAQEHVGVVIDDGVAGTVERLGEPALGERHAHGVGHSLAQGPRGGLDSEMGFPLRVAGRLGAELAEISDFLHRQRITRKMEHRIQQHGRMPVRKHESVTVEPRRVRGIELKHVPPEDFGDVRHPHGGARMAGIGLLNGVHGQSTDRIGKFAAGGH